MNALFATTNDSFLLAHRGLYQTAAALTKESGTPYAAAAVLEAWFRNEDGGGFTYDETPPEAPFGEPPLVAFLKDKRGYCQHYAGAMALMLRFVGVPARVAAGFTSGRWDPNRHEWTVTDHNAHTWVEVFFPGRGWLAFDPTPGRGNLDSAYSTAAPAFNPGDGAIAGLPGAFAGASASSTTRTSGRTTAAGRSEIAETSPARSRGLAASARPTTTDESGDAEEPPSFGSSFCSQGGLALLLWPPRRRGASFVSPRETRAGSPRPAAVTSSAIWPTKVSTRRRA